MQSFEGFTDAFALTSGRGYYTICKLRDLLPMPAFDML